MAEYVNQRLEEMIPELEEMSNIGFFSVKETKTILKIREGHEYKLRQQTKTKQAFLSYIDYEKKLLELIKFRRKKIGLDSKKRDVEKAVADRIHKLYRLVCERFSDDVSLWEDHIEFSRILNEKAYMSRLYDQVLKVHSHNENLWVKAALWESSKEGNMNPDLAREILLKAQRVNPESQLIFLEMFRMELDLAKRAVKRKQILGLTQNKPERENSEEDISDETGEIGVEFKIVSIIYDKGKEIFPGNFDLHLKTLAICGAVKEAKALQELIVQDLQSLYSDVPQVWNALALINLEGRKKLDKESFMKCLDIYQQAVGRLPTETMYSLCLNALLSLLSRRETQGADWLVKAILSIFEKSIQNGVLTETLYSELLAMLERLGLSQEMIRVSGLATADHPHSCKLWQTRLRLLSTTGQADGQQIVSMLKSSLGHIPLEEAWPVWEFVLTYHGTLESEQLQHLMEEACRNVSPAVSRSAKIWCLNFIYRQQGIKKAREFYTKYKAMRPVSLSFYQLYIQMEHSQVSPRLNHIREAFEEALTTFGQSEPDLWLNYLYWETQVTKDSSKSGDIYQRALVGLGPHLKETFIRKHVMAGLLA